MAHMRLPLAQVFVGKLREIVYNSLVSREKYGII